MSAFRVGGPDSATVRSQIAIGDVARERGVCTDVVIRAYRDAFGLDLQKLVHEDMARAFAAYPRRWGLSRPDANIDHRRAPNLQVFFQRRGRALPVSADPADYRPGDLVTQTLPGNLPHIAIVSDARSADGNDEQFYKPACFLQPVTTGPFYAFQYEPSAWVTIGGIRTNDRLQAIDGEGVAIPGLYVAGADNGTLMSAPYCDYEGYSLMCAYCGGRLAGQYAVETIDA